VSGRKTWPLAPRLSFLIVLAAAVVLCVAWNWSDEFVSLWHSLVELLEHQESLRDFTISLGSIGPLVYVGLQALQVVISPIPGEATGFIGGFLFGGWIGFFYSTAGLTLGSAAAFFLSRWFRRSIRFWLRKSAIYNRLEHLIEHQGLFLCFVLFLLPGFPKDFLCYLLGLSRMPWQAFLIIVTFGRMPGTLMLTMQGANVYNGNVRGFAGLLLLTLVVMGPTWYYRERIYDWVERHSLEE
jgi:uncharacterized membrane protein YdjX (TVP38/TMEM64 family)